MAIDPVTTRPEMTPARATFATRSQWPAPTFCAAIEDTEAPMAEGQPPDEETPRQPPEQRVPL